MIEERGELVYRMPLRYPLCFAFVIAAGPLVLSAVVWTTSFAAGDLWRGLRWLGMWTLGVVGVVLWSMFIGRYSIIVNREGVRIRFGAHWYLSWAEIQSASVRSLFGIRELRIKRRRGFRWSLWWSLPGARNFMAHAVDFIPRENPLHECIAEEIRRMEEPA